MRYKKPISYLLFYLLGIYQEAKAQKTNRERVFEKKDKNRKGVYLFQKWVEVGWSAWGRFWEQEVELEMDVCLSQPWIHAVVVVVVVVVVSWKTEELPKVVANLGRGCLLPLPICSLLHCNLPMQPQLAQLLMGFWQLH